ncbi:MAG: hypothetical protein IRZ32_07870 [Solirubrobacteraceae bacterium]|nr:hypothetical protein [Solirubrobacteraceae bacterium]
MTLQRTNAAAVTPLPLRPPMRAVLPTRPRLAEVIDLAAERERRTPPPEVLEAVDAAARTCRRLDAAGMEVRFGLEPEGVTAELRDRSGSVRTLSLHEAIDPVSLLPESAA